MTRTEPYTHDGEPTEHDHCDFCGNCLVCWYCECPEPRPAVKGGRCASGFEMDRGAVVHAVPGFRDDARSVTWGAALCGTRPGRRSVGWTDPFPADAGVTCSRCLKKMHAKLISAACEAEEVFGLDELERFANERRGR